MRCYGTAQVKLKRLFGFRQQLATPLYVAIVAAARQPRLYTDFGVADTADGRLSLIILHLHLVLQRLSDLNANSEAKALVEQFFDDMEGNLRESGVSDVTIPKRMRLVEALYVTHSQSYNGLFGAAKKPAAAALELTIPWAETTGGASSSHDHAVSLNVYCHDKAIHISKTNLRQLLWGEGVFS